MPRQTLTEVAEELLREHVTRTTTQIAEEAVARRISRAKDPGASVRKALRFNPRFLGVDEDGWVLHSRVLAHPLTHRITPPEAASATLALGADLGSLRTPAVAGLRTSEGVRLQVLRGRIADLATGVEASLALRGPEGWPGFDAGSLVAVAVIDQVVTLQEAAEPTARDRLRGRRFIATANEIVDRAERGPFGGPFIGTDEILAALLATDPGPTARPLPPLSELLEGSGLETHRGWVGLAGSDWSVLDDAIARMRRWMQERRREDLDDDDAHGDDLDDIDARFDDDLGDDVDGDPDESGFDERTVDDLVDAHRLDRTEELALGTVLDAFVIWDVVASDGTRPGASVGARRTLAQLAGIPRVALALADYALTDPRFERFAADLWAATSSRSEGAAPAYLLGAIAESRGDHALAERRYGEALAADRAFVLADLGLLGIEIDRGAYPAALGRMRRLGLPEDDPDLAWVAAQTGPALPRVGRNDPCPCGSGRKYKACHLDQPLAGSEPDPVDGLRTKVSRFMRSPEVARAMEDLVHEALGPGPAAAAPFSDDIDHDDPWVIEAESRLLDQNPELVLGFLLHERGWLQRFLDLRGSLLPAAERTLGASWTAVRMSLYEVVSTRAGSSITLRDVVADGLPVVVADRSLSRSLQPLDLAVLRLLPDGRGGIAASNAMVVPRPKRATVAAMVARGDIPGILRYVGFPDPAPQIRNMDGEPLVLVTARYRVPDASEARRVLARSLEEHEPGTFTSTVDLRGRSWTRGSVTFDGSTATITANSEVRADALVRTLLDAAPGAELLERTQQQVEDAVAALRSDPDRLSPDDLNARPEVQALLDEATRGFERTWVDESIPALGGRTPRDAIRTVAGRREVEALLDDMAWMRRRAGGSAAGLMDPERIRILLGLSSPGN